jgi:fatty-acyl-CoA synthase
MMMSYVAGTSNIPLIGETIGQNFDRCVARWANALALIVRHQKIRWTYAELSEHVKALASGLLALGLESGDRVGIWSPNNAEWVLTQLACAKIGVVLVTINPAYRALEIEFALNKSGCKGLITADQFKKSNYLEVLRYLAPEYLGSQAGEFRSQRLPYLRWTIHLGSENLPGMISFAEVLAGGASNKACGRVDERGSLLQFDDPIAIQFTSGTTGAPKGATLTHHNILNNAFFVAETMGLREGDRLCIPVPLYHCFGMVMSVLACITHGATMVFPSEAFDPAAVLETIEQEKCSALHGVPTMFIGILEHPGFRSFKVNSLRTGIMAGAPCPIEVMRRVVGELNMREITIAYGMTETSPVSFQSSISDPLERRVTTVGRVHPHIEVKIVDTLGNVVPRGTTGELLTRGYSVMRGYWGDPERTSQVIDEAGWMRTGDVATICEEGYCNIVGRLKDMVIRGGENIYPREIEELLFRHSMIESVQVVGVPDWKYGEELCAFIKLRDGATMAAPEVRAFLDGQVSHYKIPKYIRFVSEFPMTVTGKVQKFHLRQMLMQELGLSDSQTA